MVDVENTWYLLQKLRNTQCIYFHSPNLYNVKGEYENMQVLREHQKLENIFISVRKF